MKRSRRLHLLLLLALFASCHSLLKSKPEQFSGTLELTEYAVGARVGGRVARLTVDEGMLVKKGQLLATLDRYDQTKKDFERTLKLKQQGGATAQALELAELTFEDQQIVSPVDGVVLLKNHEVGEVVGSGTSILVIGDDLHPWVRIFVPEGIINRVSLGDQASLRFDGLEREYTGKVVTISPKAEFTPRNVQTEEERVTQTFAVKVLLTEPNQGLKPGVATDVYLTMKNIK